LGDISQLDTGIAIDLMPSYRAASVWHDVVTLVEMKMGRPLADTVKFASNTGLL